MALHEVKLAITCEKCSNTALGLVKESLDISKSLTEYIQAFQEVS